MWPTLHIGPNKFRWLNKSNWMFTIKFNFLDTVTMPRNYKKKARED